MPAPSDDQISVSIAPDAQVILQISKPGLRVEALLPNDGAGIVATILLGAAKDSAEKAAQDKGWKPTGVAPRANVLPSRIGLDKSQRPDHETLYFECGHAAIGFDMPRGDLRKLAHAMLAMSAEGTAH
jgi:hypothetical protein